MLAPLQAEMAPLRTDEPFLPAEGCIGMGPPTPQDSEAADANAYPAKKLGAESVAKWLETMGNGIPFQVLKSLKAYVLKNNIDNRQFTSLVTHCQVEAVDVDHITPVHLVRLRKAWNMDAMDVDRTDVRTSGPQENLSPALRLLQDGAGCRQQQSLSGNDLSQYLGIAISHLAQWAGFDVEAAIVELKSKLPPELVESLPKSLHRSSKEQRCANMLQTPRSQVSCRGETPSTGHPQPDGRAIGKILLPEQPESDVMPGEQSSESHDGHHVDLIDGGNIVLDNVGRLAQHIQQNQGTRESGSIGCARGPAYVAEWIRNLPPSVLQENQRESVANFVEDNHISGDDFQGFVSCTSNDGLTEVPAGRVAKMRQAWEKVLREDSFRHAAIESQKHKVSSKPVKLIL
jgi:hypothetical protein